MYVCCVDELSSLTLKCSKQKLKRIELKISKYFFIVFRLAQWLRLQQIQFTLKFRGPSIKFWFVSHSISTIYHRKIIFVCANPMRLTVSLTLECHLFGWSIWLCVHITYLCEFLFDFNFRLVLCHHQSLNHHSTYGYCIWSRAIYSNGIIFQIACLRGWLEIWLYSVLFNSIRSTVADRIHTSWYATQWTNTVCNEKPIRKKGRPNIKRIVVINFCLIKNVCVELCNR